MWNKPVLVLWHSRPKCVPRLQLWIGDCDENTWSVKTVKVAEFLAQDNKAENSCHGRRRLEAAGRVSSSPCDPDQRQQKTGSRFAVILRANIALFPWIRLRNNLEFNETFLESRWWSEENVQKIRSKNVLVLVPGSWHVPKHGHGGHAQEFFPEYEFIALLSSLT